MVDKRAKYLVTNAAKGTRLEYDALGDALSEFNKSPFIQHLYELVPEVNYEWGTYGGHYVQIG